MLKYSWVVLCAMVAQFFLEGRPSLMLYLLFVISLCFGFLRYGLVYRGRSLDFYYWVSGFVLMVVGYYFLFECMWARLFIHKYFGFVGLGFLILLVVIMYFFERFVNKKVLGFFGLGLAFGFFLSFVGYDVILG